MKATLRMGYKTYVLDAEDALQIISILDEKAEQYEEQYHRGTDSEESFNTHHVWDNEDKCTSLELMPSSTYRLAKLAGKPTKD